jgi:hypothetical protein
VGGRSRFGWPLSKPKIHSTSTLHIIRMPDALRTVCCLPKFNNPATSDAVWAGNRRIRGDRSKR